MMTTKRLTKAEREKKAAVFEAQQKEDQMLRDAQTPLGSGLQSLQTCITKLPAVFVPEDQTGSGQTVP